MACLFPMLPDWLPLSLWDEFKKNRKKLRAPMTEYGEGLILAKLDRWKLEGADVIAILNESIENGWRGVFLNGHAAPGTESQSASHGVAGTQGSVGLKPIAPVCCMCGLSMASGFIHTSKGRKCHNC